MYFECRKYSNSSESPEDDPTDCPDRAICATPHRRLWRAFGRSESKIWFSGSKKDQNRPGCSETPKPCYLIDLWTAWSRSNSRNPSKPIMLKYQQLLKILVRMSILLKLVSFSMWSFSKISGSWVTIFLEGGGLISIIFIVTDSKGILGKREASISHKSRQSTKRSTDAGKVSHWKFRLGEMNRKKIKIEFQNLKSLMATHNYII